MPVSERQLAPVPATAWSQPGLSSSLRWSAEYNVACWLRGRNGKTVRLTLVIRYRDAGGGRQVMVDQVECRQETSQLLAGRCRIPAVGRIEEMSVWLLGEPSCDIQVDELYVQRVGADAARPLLAAR